MVEGGRIDHALHGTNAKRALEDTVAFDNAIKTALAKVDLTNTLIVVTADHDHTMTINGYSAKAIRSSVWSPIKTAIKPPMSMAARTPHRCLVTAAIVRPRVPI